MAGDAIAVFHPTDLEKLTPFLDLDDENEESEGLYAEELDDGTFLVHTFQPFAVFEENPTEARIWLAQFGDALPDIHDDPRGLLFFPDTLEPTATTYDAVVAELADKGIFFATGLVDEADNGEPGIDMDALQDLAAQLMGGQGGAAGSFEIGQLFGNVQQHLAEALGLPQQGEPSEDVPGDVIDEEFEAEEPRKK